jgi:hypothetical protein
VLAGCGEQTKRVAATPTPTRATVTTATATPEPAGDQQAGERLARIRSEDALDRGRICSPAADLPDPAIAAVGCGYDGDSEGRYLLFESRADQEVLFPRPRRGGKQIRGPACSGPHWRRGRNRRTEVRLALVRLTGGRNVLIWADDSQRLLGDIPAGSPPARETCTIWETRG